MGATGGCFSSRMMCRRECLLALAALAASTPFAARSALGDSLQERGAAETAALAAAQREYDEAQARLQDVGSRLESTQVSIHETQVQLEQLGRDIEDTKSGIDTTTSDLEAAQAALAAFLEINYKSGSTSILDVLLSSADFNDFVTRAYYARAVQDSQVETINEIKDLKASLERQEQVLERQQDEQTQLLSELSEQEQSLTAQRDEADAIVAGLSTEVQQLFAAQQAELQAAAQARSQAASAAQSASELGLYVPGVSQGSVVEDAYACLGLPYVWGGDDENFATHGGFDCSGLTQHCYALEGYTIGRTTWDQIDQIQAAGNWVESVDQLLPGDLAFPSDGHVGVYIGNGQMIDAPYPGMYVRIDQISEFIGGGSPV